MSHDLLLLRQINFKLATACKINPSFENLTASRNYKKFYKSSVRKAKRQFFADKMREAGSCSRLIWGVINLAANKPTKSSGVDSLKVADRLITGEQDIADVFNDHYSSIGTKVADSLPIPDVGASFRDYLGPIASNSLWINAVFPPQITETILKIAKKGSRDVKDVSFQLIHKVAHQVSLPFSHIFNLSVSNGIFPDYFKN